MMRTTQIHILLTRSHTHLLTHITYLLLILKPDSTNSKILSQWTGLVSAHSYLVDINDSLTHIHAGTLASSNVTGKKKRKGRRRKRGKTPFAVPTWQHGTAH